ncbi:hypothetical protein [Streptomyces fragilis]|uniref:Heparin binding hemagglutinin HbhA n=1 Tax=Streptomyces fragilis TaxID=67301 RepID=A0ABV2YMF2_9ACTN|nr:hypothetical protein [Streptomyces fragilis]
MAITDDLRKTLSDPTPLYFAAGTADLALQQARKVPALVEQIRAEAPARIEAVKAADPEAVKEKAVARVKETTTVVQTKVSEVVSGLEPDLKKLGETAQGLALRGVGRALEYAVKARETYERVAEHGEQAVRVWRGEAADGIVDAAAAVEPRASKPAPAETPVAQPPAAPDEPAEAKDGAAATEPAAEATAKKAAPARKAPARRTAKKATPPAE